MVFSEEDKSLIKWYLVNWGPMRLINEFPLKNWKKRGLDKLLNKLTLEPGSFNVF